MIPRQAPEIAAPYKSRIGGRQAQCVRVLLSGAAAGCLAAWAPEGRRRARCRIGQGGGPFQRGLRVQTLRTLDQEEAESYHCFT